MKQEFKTNVNDICKISIVRSSDLVCSNFVYEVTDIQSKNTRTENYVFGYVVEGNGTIVNFNNSLPLSEGDAFFIQKNTTFSILQDGNLKYFYISFDGRRADELVDRLELNNGAQVFNFKSNYKEITSFAFDCLKKATDHNTDLFAESTLLYLFAHLENKKTEYNDLLSKIITITNSEFTSLDFTLGMLAQYLNYDPKYISFFFKKSKGICYTDYLRDLRIKRAVFLMEQGMTSIKNIALLSGFKDALYFSKIFKQEIGKSPKDYINYLEQTSKE
ncbi:MAG: AraC family transcriptional regulator [Clostridia bacterium]|nr:AraC family transcriptional regulator [Clostridia bacterium]